MKLSFEYEFKILRLYCKSILVLSLLSMGMCTVALAATANRSSIQSELFLNTEPEVNRNNKISLKALFSVYSATKVESNDLNQLSEFDIMFSRKKRKYFQLNYDLGFKYTNELEAFPYPNLKQAYYHIPTGDKKLSWSIGKKLKTWSEFDRVWKLGVWEPVLKPNLLRPERQGLAGVFLNYRSKSYKFTGFMSPFFVPDVGPQFKVKQGTLFSSNRWFQAPIGGIEYQGQELTPVYSLQTPDMGDIILNTTTAFSFHWGLKRGPWTKLSLANKPMNQIQIQLGKLQMILEDDTVPVDIHPFVQYHNLVSLELGWKSNRFNSWVSLTQDRPNVTDVPEGFVRPAVVQHQFIAINIEHDWKVFGLRDWKVRWGAFKRIESELAKSEGNADFDVKLADLRYPYEDAAMVSLAMPLKIPIPIMTSLQLIASPSQQGASLLADIVYRSSEKLSYDFGFEIVGADDEDSKGFFNQYRNNDRVYGGMSYVF